MPETVVGGYDGRNERVSGVSRSESGVRREGSVEDSRHDVGEGQLVYRLARVLPPAPLSGSWDNTNLPPRV